MQAKQMDTFSVFVSLPTSVGLTIISNWLTAKDIGMLDAAFCNHPLRKLLLELFAHPTTLDTACHSEVFSSRIYWMYTRDVKCPSLHFCGRKKCSQDDIALMHAYLQNVGAVLQAVCIYDADDNLADMVLKYLASHSCALHNITVLSGKCPRYATPVSWDSSLRTILVHSAAVLTALHANSPVDRLLGGVYLPALRKIDMKINIDEDLVIMCRAAPSLTSITLHNPRCTSIGLAAIGQHCRNLEKLEIAAAWHVTGMNAGITAIAQGCRKLKKLSLYLCEDLDHTGLMAVGTHCTQLEDLYLHIGNRVTDASLSMLMQQLGTTLRSLCVSMGHLTGAYLADVAQYCTSLHTLDISYNRSSTAVSLHRMIPHLTSTVTKLNIIHCQIEDRTLKLIAQYMPQLTYLNIETDFTPMYTCNGVTRVVRKCTSLTTLKLCNRPKGLSDELLAAWQAFLPGLAISHFFDSMSW